MYSLPPRPQGFKNSSFHPNRGQSPEKKGRLSRNRPRWYFSYLNNTIDIIPALLPFYCNLISRICLDSYFKLEGNIDITGIEEYMVWWLNTMFYCM